MAAWIRGTLAAMLAFAACWGGAVWHWRAAGRMPSSTDLLAWLLALPLLLLVCGAVAWRLAQARSAPEPADAAGPAPEVPLAPSRLPMLALLDAAVCTPHGDSAQELGAAIAAQRARSDLDPELVDDAGYPVMSLRAAAADDATWRADAEPWLAGQGLAEARFGEAHWRALGLATGVVRGLAEAALAAGDVPDIVPPLLRIAPLIPVDWTAAQRAAASAWLVHVAAQAGWDARQVAAVPVPPGEATALLSQLARLAGPAALDDGPALTIVLAFDSRIDQAAVDQMAAENILFTAARPQGLIPGEGAAGLLLAEPALARRIAPATPTLQADGAARAASADASGRVDATDLRQLAGRILADAGIAATAVSALVADADHRSNRLLEVMALAHEDLPRLDPGSDVLATGPACGRAGAVPFLAALALARQHVLDGADAVLCVGNADPIYRTAALVLPAGGAR
jgi:hypothetical protein